MVRQGDDNREWATLRRTLQDEVRASLLVPVCRLIPLVTHAICYLDMWLLRALFLSCSMMDPAPVLLRLTQLGTNLSFFLSIYSLVGAPQLSSFFFTTLNEQQFDSGLHER